jgi:hypothetical protein
MNAPLLDQSNEAIAREIIKPLKQWLARQDELLQKADDLIREAEKKSKLVLHPPEP